MFSDILSPTQLALLAFYLLFAPTVWLVTKRPVSTVLAASASFGVLYGALNCGFIAVPPPPHLRHPTKVFGIGLSRTGTSSLTLALNQAGIKAYHALPQLLCWGSEAQPTMNARWAAAYDGLTDIQPAIVFASLHKEFPDAKFVYNHRQPKLWAKAMHKFMNQHSMLWWRLQQVHDWIGFVPPVERLFEATYGSWREYSIMQWEERYNAHDKAVATFFQNKSSQLLNISFTQGEGWEKLGPFLGVENPPKGPFPRSDVFALTATYQPYWQMENLVHWLITPMTSADEEL